MSLPLLPLGLLGRTQPPAFPILRSTNNHAPGTFNITHTVDLPAGVQAGDLVVFAYFARSSGDMGSIPTPSGWTSLALLDISPGAFLTALVRVVYRVATGPMTTITVTSPGANSGIASNSYCFSQWGGIKGSAFAQGASVGPDPPNLAPSGWGTNPRVTWISLMAIRASVVTVDSTSSGFTDEMTSTYGGAPFARISSSRREERAPSLDPGPWGLSGSQDWGACTIAVRGA